MYVVACLLDSDVRLSEHREQVAGSRLLEKLFGHGEVRVHACKKYPEFAHLALLFRRSKAIALRCELLGRLRGVGLVGEATVDEKIEPGAPESLSAASFTMSGLTVPCSGPMATATILTVHLSRS